jgi:hypothetical protein
MPYIAAVGTNTRFSYSLAQASIFWVLALAVMTFQVTSPKLQEALVLMCMGITCGIVALVTIVAFRNGGEDDSEWEAGTSVTVAGGALKLNSDDATALATIADLRQTYRLDQSTPSIDVTGIGSPGYQLQLGTRPLGRATYYGFFSGGKDAARYGFSLESCADRAKAWVLYAENNPADLSGAHTAGVLDLSTDYELIATFAPTQGRPEWKALTVQVLRPHSHVFRKLGC